MVEQLGGPDKIVFREHTLSPPGPEQVLIEVKYAGVNFPDTLIIRGMYQFRPRLPFSPGGEVAGIIKRVGSNVAAFKPGDRVVSGTSWGGFAEEALGWASNTHLLPEKVSFEEAAATLMTFGTAIHALRDRAKLKKEETLVILGASGGVGTAAIQIGSQMGAKVIACASSQKKLAHCTNLGVNNTCLYASDNPKNLKESLKALTEGRGADVIFDPVGGNLSSHAFRSIAPMGRHLVIGFASGNIPGIPWNLPLLKSASIVGVFWGNFFRNYPKENKENVRQIIDLLARSVIKPKISRIFSLKNADEALRMIENRQVIGKILLKM